MTGRIIKDESQASNRLPEIGKIKCGEMTEGKNGTMYPKSLDYFIGYGKYKEYFDKVYSNPNKIQIVFYSDNIAEVCNERYELRDKAGKLFGRGDGSTFEVWDGKGYGEFKVSDYPDLMLKAAKKAESLKGWEKVLTLRFIIPKILGVYGAWSLETKADDSSIPQITGMFDEVLARAGTVKRIVFDLTVKKHTSQKPGDKSSYPVINLIPNVSEENLGLVKAFIEANQNVTMINDAVLRSTPQLTEHTEETGDDTPDCFNYSSEEAAAEHNQ